MVFLSFSELGLTLSNHKSQNDKKLIYFFENLPSKIEADRKIKAPHSLLL